MIIRFTADQPMNFREALENAITSSEFHVTCKVTIDNIDSISMPILVFVAFSQGFAWPGCSVQDAQQL